MQQTRIDADGAIPGQFECSAEKMPFYDFGYL
jgi:hypothetical protein